VILADWKMEMHTRQRRRGKMKAAGSDEGAWNAIDWV
jgi:hypothetical protein